MLYQVYQECPIYAIKVTYYSLKFHFMSVMEKVMTELYPLRSKQQTCYNWGFWFSWITLWMTYDFFFFQLLHTRYAMVNGLCFIYLQYHVFNLFKIYKKHVFILYLQGLHNILYL